MKFESLPSNIQPVILDLLNRGVDVWLIGSRANSTSNLNSDWDFIVFGDATLLSELRTLPPVENIDLLVVIDGNHFECVWPDSEDGEIKKGDLKGWKWSRTSPALASYAGTKWPNDWGAQKQAILVTP